MLRHVYRETHRCAYLFVTTRANRQEWEILYNTRPNFLYTFFFGGHDRGEMEEEKKNTKLIELCNMHVM